MAALYIIVLLVLTAAAYVWGRARSSGLRAAGEKLHSLPGYHGSYTAIAVALPMIAVFLLWSSIAPYLIESRVLGSLPASLQPADPFARASVLREIGNATGGGALAEQSAPEIRQAAEQMGQLHAASDWLRLAAGFSLGLVGLLWSRAQISKTFRARNRVEQAVLLFLLACSAVAVLTTVGIVASLLFESLRFFAQYPWYKFLFGTQWSPQIAIRADQVGQSGAFGFIPILCGTLLITAIAMMVAAPVGLFSAIYMAEYASPRFRTLTKPVLEILAGVPTVVFGFFAALTIAPLVRSTGTSLGFDVASESALAAGLVMGIMIIPFVSSLSDDIINAVPQFLRDGSYALGATRAETIKFVVLPAAFAGIISALMLAISRAIGETMIVVMAAGLAGNLTLNPLHAVTTITVQIKSLLVGDQEFDSVKTLSAFALGLVLFFFTLMLNTIALKIVAKYREQYD
jgi:phosphate transport system permease protein